MRTFHSLIFFVVTVLLVIDFCDSFLHADAKQLIEMFQFMKNKVHHVKTVKHNKLPVNIFFILPLINLNHC